MVDYLNKYGYTPDREAIGRALDIIAANLENVASEQVYKECFSMMDLTTLKTDDTPASVTKLVNKVNAFQASYPEWPLPASICVYSNFAATVKEARKADFNITVVSACFPTSQSFLEVKLKDALFIVHPKASSEAQQEIFDKIVSDTLQTPYTWETQLSELGQKNFDSQEEKQAAVKALWEELIDSNKVGYMALLRNLRNILQAQVSPAHIVKVAATISDPVKVENSKQLPFRFLAAYKELTGVTSVHTSTLLSALERAVKASVANLEGFGPDTNVLVAADVSGSMFSPISMRSSVMNYDIGILLSMLLKSKCSSVISGMFGDTWEVLNLPQENILANTIEMKEREGEVGYSTNGYAVIDYLIENNIKMDKVMVFTDMQMWDSRFADKHLQASWNRYRQMYPEAKLYLFDLAGYGDAPVRLVSDDVILIAGWSDKVFDVLKAIESGEDALAQINKIEI